MTEAEGWGDARKRSQGTKGKEALAAVQGKAELVP